jgi:hypothetical protein
MSLFLVKPYVITVKDVAFHVYVRFFLDVLSWGFSLMTALIYKLHLVGICCEQRDLFTRKFNSRLGKKKSVVGFMFVRNMIKCFGGNGRSRWWEIKVDFKRRILTFRNLASYI